jgi:DNA-binding NarL/FixJ family response regulator
VVAETPGFEGVGEAASAEEALELAVALRPPLALVAAGMPGIDGFETCRRLVTAVPGTTAVVLYAAIAPNPNVLAGSAAVAALQLDGLTPDSLQNLWEKHGSR